MVTIQSPCPGYAELSIAGAGPTWTYPQDENTMSIPPVKRLVEAKPTIDGAGERFLLVSGEPIGERVAWRGPIVMNTEEELHLAYGELRDGTFIKHG